MALPPELLNRVNRDLTAKVQKAAADLARSKDILRLNEEVFRETTQQLTSAKSQFSALQSVMDRNADLLRGENERLTIARREAEKAATGVTERNNRAADLMKKVTFVDDQLGSRRVTLKEVEKERTAMEEAMLTWLADNAVAGEATSMADGVIKMAEVTAKRLQGEADTLQLKLRMMEDTVWEESLALDQVQSEVEGARQQKSATIAELANIKNQLEQLTERGESVDAQGKFLREQGAALEEKILTGKQARDALKQELASANAIIQKTLQIRGQEDGLRGRRSNALSEAQQRLKEEELKCDELEIHIRHTNDDIKMLLKQRADLADHRDALAAQQGRYDAKLAALTQRYVEVMQTASTEGDTTADVEVLARQLTKEMTELDAALLRGQHLVQQRRRQMVEAACSSDDTSDQCAQLQNHITTAKSKQHSLISALTNLTAACDTIATEAESIEERLNAEKIRRMEANTELRKAYQERIGQLRLELQEHERANLQAKKSLEATQSAVRLEARGLDGEKDLIVSLEEERNSNAREINALVTELEGLAVRKQKIGGAAEGLHWQLEGLRQQAEENKGEVIDQLQQKQRVELQMKQHEGGIKAEMEGLLVMLHAHQEEKTKMGIRHNALSQRCGLLRSRYEDMMAALSRKVYGPDGEAASGGHGQLLIEGSSSIEVVEKATPEDLQAHMMLAKAQERDELQQKGDTLDTAIVAAERDLRQLTTAIQKLQESYSTGRALVREGYSVDAVLYGNAQQLVIAGGASREEEELMNFVRTRLETNDGEVMRAEIAQWADVITKLNSDLTACHVQEQRVHASLAKASTSLGALRAQHSAKERQYQEISRECSAEVNLSEKARVVAFQKQASLLKKPSYSVAAATVAGVDRISEAVRRLVKCTSSHSPQCFYDLRTLTDKFGLPVDSSSFEPLGHGPQVASATLLRSSPSSQPPHRSTSSRPAANNQQSSRMAALNPNIAPPRAATKALVQAYVSQQTANAKTASYRDPLNNYTTSNKRAPSMGVRGTSAYGTGLK